MSKKNLQKYIHTAMNHDLVPNSLATGCSYVYFYFGQRPPARPHCSRSIDIDLGLELNRPI